MESRELAPKVKATYQAVIQLFMEGADLNNLTVAEITGKAGIGKGTAYEYFPNKEEMIAGALFYSMKDACRSLYARMGQEKSLYGKVNLVLLDMEKHLTQANCFFRALYVLMDNSAISGKLKEMVKGRQDGEVLVMDVIGRILEEEIGPGRKLTAEEKVYMTLTVLSKLISFAMFQFNLRSAYTGLDGIAVREMLCQSICREVEGFKAGLA